MTTEPKQFSTNADAFHKYHTRFVSHNKKVERFKVCKTYLHRNSHGISDGNAYYNLYEITAPSKNLDSTKCAATVTKHCVIARSLKPSVKSVEVLNCGMDIMASEDIYHAKDNSLKRECNETNDFPRRKFHDLYKIDVAQENNAEVEIKNSKEKDKVFQALNSNIEKSVHNVNISRPYHKNINDSKTSVMKIKTTVVPLYYAGAGVKMNLTVNSQKPINCDPKDFFLESQHFTNNSNSRNNQLHLGNLKVRRSIGLNHNLQQGTTTAHSTLKQQIKGNRNYDMFHICIPAKRTPHDRNNGKANVNYCFNQSATTTEHNFQTPKTTKRKVFPFKKEVINYEDFGELMFLPHYTSFEKSALASSEVKKIRIILNSLKNKVTNENSQNTSTVAQVSIKDRAITLRRFHAPLSYYYFIEDIVYHNTG